MKALSWALIDFSIWMFAGCLTTCSICRGWSKQCQMSSWEQLHTTNVFYFLAFIKRPTCWTLLANGGSCLRILCRQKNFSLISAGWQVACPRCPHQSNRWAKYQFNIPRLSGSESILALCHKRTICLVEEANPESPAVRKSPSNHWAVSSSKGSVESA